MSRSFSRLFVNSFKNIFLNDTRYKFNNEIEVRKAALIIVIGAFAHGAYALGTSKSDKSKIVKKYKMVRNGFTEFMVVDEQGNHYNVNNSFWYWKWDSIEDWTNIKEGDVLYFKRYGWRVPVLGLFPNIYMANRSQFLDSMTSAEFITFEHKQNNKNAL